MMAAPNIERRAMSEASEARPLEGIRLLELGGIGPAPFAGMLFADLGADVIRIDRPGGEPLSLGDRARVPENRGKRSVVLDLKQPAAVEAVLMLAATADAVVEGWRPGVADRLGVGSAQCRQRNPRLVYGHMTGWGQRGPWSGQAGHDITYLASVGALHAIGPAGGPPQIPLNLLGDFGGGSLYLAVGLLAGILSARATGVGRDVDAAIVDGVGHLLTPVFGMLARGRWRDERGANLLDGGSPFYAVYETADGRHVAVGSLESQFYRELLAKTGAGADPDRQYDVSTWPALRAELTEIFGSRTLAEWAQIFEGSDACVEPVVSMTEATTRPNNAERGVFVESDGVVQPAPAPRFSSTALPVNPLPADLGADTVTVLQAAGVADIEQLLETGAAVQASGG